MIPTLVKVNKIDMYKFHIYMTGKEIIKIKKRRSSGIPSPRSIKFMLSTKVIESEMRAERMNGRDVLYYLGWNYGWRDGHVKVGHIGKNHQEELMKLEEEEN